MSKFLTTLVVSGIALAAQTSQAADMFSRPEISSLTVSPATAVIGEPAILKIDGNKNGTMDCAISVEYGDGTQEFIEVHQGLPKEVQHVYAKPGTYTAKAIGVDHNNVNNCKGQASTTFKVSGVRAPACPSGWEITPGSVKKNGAFSCRALPPAEPMKCSVGLKPYASNGVIGCK